MLTWVNVESMDSALCQQLRVVATRTAVSLHEDTVAILVLHVRVEREYVDLDVLVELFVGHPALWVQSNGARQETILWQAKFAPDLVGVLEELDVDAHSVCRLRLGWELEVRREGFTGGVGAGDHGAGLAGLCCPCPDLW